MEPRDQMLHDAIECLVEAMKPIVDNQDNLNHEKTINVMVNLAFAYGKTYARCLLKSKKLCERIKGRACMRIISGAKESASN